MTENPFAVFDSQAPLSVAEDVPTADDNPFAQFSAVEPPPAPERVRQTLPITPVQSMPGVSIIGDDAGINDGITAIAERNTREGVAKMAQTARDYFAQGIEREVASYRAGRPELQDASGNQFTRGLARGLTTGGEMLGGAVRQIAESAGSDKLARIGEAVQGTAALERARLPEMKVDKIADVKSIGDFGNWMSGKIGEGIGSSSTILAGGAVGGWFGAAVGGWGLGVGSMRNELETAGVPQERMPEYAYTAGSVIGALDAIVPAGLMNSLSGNIKQEIAKQVVRRMAVATAKGSMKEGVTEALQEAVAVAGVAAARGDQEALAMLQNAAQGVYAERARIAEAGAAGAAAGSAFGVAEGAGSLRGGQTVNRSAKGDRLTPQVVGAPDQAPASGTRVTSHARKAATDAAPAPTIQRDAAPETRAATREQFSQFLALEDQLAAIPDDVAAPPELINQALDAEEAMVESFRATGLPGDNLARGTRPINSMDDVRRAFDEATPEEINEFWQGKAVGPAASGAVVGAGSVAQGSPTGQASAPARAEEGGASTAPAGAPSNLRLEKSGSSAAGATVYDAMIDDVAHAQVSIKLHPKDKSVEVLSIGNDRKQGKLKPEFVSKIKAALAREFPGYETAFGKEVGERAPLRQAARDLTTDFLRLIATPTPRDQWAQTLGVSEDELMPHVERAIASGLLRVDRNGVVRRNASAVAEMEPEVEAEGQKIEQAIEAGAGPLLAPGIIDGENVTLTPKAIDKIGELQAIAEEAVAKILPRDVRIEVVDNIAIDRLAHEDNLLALQSAVAQTQTPEFKRWFGDSKVVDADGKPLTLYHGTGADIDRFNGMAWGSETPELANDYAAMRGVTGGRSNVIPVYLRIETPFDADALPKVVNIEEFFDEVLEQANTGGRQLSPELSSLIDTVHAGARRERSGPRYDRHEFWNDAVTLFGEDGARAIREIFQKSGFDGIKMTEGKALTFGAFDPTQIKSAIGNRGTFDANDPRISFSLRSSKSAKVSEGTEGESDEAGLPGDSNQAGQASNDASRSGDAGSIAAAVGGGGASGASAAEGRILRQESATLRADGSPYIGRPADAEAVRKNGDRDAAPQQRVGETSRFAIDGLDGTVTADALSDYDRTVGNLARLTYKAHDGGKLAGEMEVIQRSDGAWEVEFVTAVRPRKGVGTRLHNAVESDLGIRMSPSGVQSDEGLAFWKKRSPESVRWHVATPTWPGFHFSPRKVKEELLRVSREVTRLANGTGKAATMEPKLRQDLLGSYRKERGQLIALLGGMSAEARTAAPTMFSLRAFHGTRHDFDRFDMSKIGTGEGAQVFGHGLYFAENEGVGKRYHQTLSRVSANERVPSVQYTEKELRDMAQKERNVERAEYFNYIADRMNGGRSFTGAIRGIPEQPLLDAFGDTIIKRPGGLYEVDIDVEPHQLLDLDEKVGKQPVAGAIADLLLKLEPKFTREQIENMLRVQYGKHVYDEIAFHLNDEPTRASKALRDAGIPGLRYLDQGSRDAGDGTRNIVIFDDSLIKITHKNGEPVTAAERQAVVDEMFSLRTADPALEEGAVAKFGTTRDPNEAGYVLSDGRMLDLSGRSEIASGGTTATYEPFTEEVVSGKRWLDHRDLDGVLELSPEAAGRMPLLDPETAAQTARMYDFMAQSGAVRYRQADGFEAVGMPTPMQLRAILRAYQKEYAGSRLQVDVTDPKTGNVIASKAFDRPMLDTISAFLREHFPTPMAIRLIDGAVEALGQTNPDAKIISIGARAVEAEARATGKTEKKVTVETARHEALEFFLAKGFIKPDEWATLTDTARKENWIEAAGVREPYTAQFGETMDAAQLEDLILKESIMVKYGEYEQGNYKPKGLIAKVFKRLKDFLDRLRNRLKSQGFQRWEDIFQKMDAGEMRQRYEARFGAPAAESKSRVTSKAVPADGVAALTIPKGAKSPAMAPGSPGPTPGTAASAPGSLVDIQRNLRRKLGLTVASGRLDPKMALAAGQMGEKLMGQFDRQTEVIRLRALQDIDTESHEVAHALENRYTGLANLQQAHAQELDGVANLTGQSGLSEGFAEFFRLYLTNPSAADAHAPRFRAAFENFIETEDAQVLQDIQEIQAQYQQWRDASSAGRITAAVKSGVPEGTWEKIRAEYDRGGLTRVGGMFWAYLEQVYKSRIDRTNPIRVLVERIARQAEAVNQDIDLSAWRNPQAQARKIPAADGIAYMDITRGVGWENAAGRGSISLRDALSTAFGGTGYEHWTPQQRDDFGAYLIARRGRWLWQRHDMDPARNRGRMANPPQNPQAGDWYFDTMTRQRRVYLRGRWETELTRAPDKHTRADHEQAVADLEAANPQFAVAAQMVYQFNRDLALKRFQAGLDSQDEFDYKNGATDYVPWFRDMTDAIFAGTGVSGRKVQGKFKIRGSYRDFINPVEGIIRQVYDTNREIAVNKPKRLLAQLAETVQGAGKIAEVIPATRMTTQEVKVREALAQAAKAEGLPPEDAKDMIAAVAAMIGDDAVATLFRSEQAGDGRDAVLHYMDGGELKMLQIHDDERGIARDILGFFELLKHTPAADSFFSMVTAAVRVPQKAITSSLGFLYRNIIRDTMQAAALQAGYFPIVSNIRTIASNRVRRGRGEESWGELLARHGGIMGGIGRTDVQQIKQGRVAEMRTDAVTLKPWERQFWKQTVNPWHEDFWRWAEWSEANARQTLARISFDRAIKDVQARYPTMPADQQTFVALESAVHRSRDYTDYSRMGDAPSQAVLNRTLMFLNPSLQGPDKMIRALFLAQTNEGRFATAQLIRKKIAPLFNSDLQYQSLTKSEIDALKDAARAWLTISIIAHTHLLLEVAFNDPDELEDKSKLERATSVSFTINGVDYRIPRGFDVINVASNAVKAGYESWQREDPTAWARFRETLGVSLLPAGSSPILDLYIGWKHGKNNFFSSDIEPTYMQGRLPEDRYSAYTSNLSRQVAEGVNSVAPFEVSPLMVEYSLTTIGADWARDIMRAYDVADPNKPALRWQEYPFLRAARGLRGTRGAEEFWKLMGQDGSFVQAAASYREEAVKGKAWSRDDIRKFFDQRLKDEDAKAYSVMLGHYNSEQKRLHPMERAREFARGISGTMRDVASNRIDVPITSKKEKRVEVSREVRAQALEILAEIGRREYRNALIALKRPGYENREPQPVKPYLTELKTISPEIHKSLIARITNADGSARVYDYDKVRELWPDTRKKLLATDKRERIIESQGDVEFSDLLGRAQGPRAAGIR